MAQFIPNATEISILEQIETVYCDAHLPSRERERRVADLWQHLDAAHGCPVYSVTSPNGIELLSPFLAYAS